MAKKDKDNSVEFLALLNSRLTLAERFGKNWTKDAQKWEKDYNIKTILEAKIEGLDNQIQVPYIFNTIETGLPAIFEMMPSIIMKQRGKEDRDFTEFADKIWNYVHEKTKLTHKIEEIGTHFLITGLGIAKYGWTLETEEVDQPTDQPVLNEDGTPAVDPSGQPIIQTTNQKVQMPVKDLPFIKFYSYKDVYFSPESRFAEDDEENMMPYIYCKSVLSPDEIEYEYKTKVGDDISKGYLDMKEIDPDASSSTADDKDLVKSDLERLNVYDYYGVLPKDFSGDENWRPNKVYYMAFIKGQILKKPEEISKKPFVLTGNYGLPTQFFKFGEPHAIRGLEQDVSLGRSRIADLRDKQGTKIALPQGTQVDENALKRSKDYVIMRFVGTQPPAYVTPPPIPETILVALKQSKEDIQLVTSQLNGDSNIDTATGQKIYQGGTDKKYSRKKMKIGRMIKEIAKNVLILCAYNWDVEKFAQITDMDSQELEQLGYIKKMQELGNDFDLEIDVDNITNNKETMAAQAIALYREVKDDPLINREEIVKQVLKIGFGVKDFDRFLSGQPTPDQILQSLEFLAQNQLIAPEQAQQLALALREVMPPDGSGSTGDVGRPSTQDPVDVVKKSAPAASNTQQVAQTKAAYKQTGVAKGPQGV